MHIFCNIIQLDIHIYNIIWLYNITIYIYIHIYICFGYMHNCVCMYRCRCTPCLIYSSALKLSVRKSTSLKSRHFEQLLKLFEQFGTPDKRRYLFLGGYMNKGPRSLDTTCLLFLYKAISGRPERILETSPILTFRVVSELFQRILLFSWPEYSEIQLFWQYDWIARFFSIIGATVTETSSGLLVGDSILYLRWYLGWYSAMTFRCAQPPTTFSLAGQLTPFHVLRGTAAGESIAAAQ